MSTKTAQPTKPTPKPNVQNKLKELQKNVRTGGKGTQRRKTKKKPRQSSDNEKKISQTIKRLGSQPLDGIEEVNMFKKDGKVIQITKPKVQAALNANTFMISGNVEEKPLNKLPVNDIIAQIGAAGLQQYQSQLGGLGGGLGGAGGDDDVPDLIGTNFDQPTSENKETENKEETPKTENTGGEDEPPQLDDD